MRCRHIASFAKRKASAASTSSQRIAIPPSIRTAAARMSSIWRRAVSRYGARTRRRIIDAALCASIHLRYAVGSGASIVRKSGVVRRGERLHVEHERCERVVVGGGRRIDARHLERRRVHRAQEARPTVDRGTDHSTAVPAPTA